MKELTLEEKIKIINQSKNLEEISISALPKVFGSSYFLNHNPNFFLLNKVIIKDKNQINQVR